MFPAIDPERAARAHGDDARPGAVLGADRHANRVASARVSPVEIAVSLCLLLCAIGVVAWIAGKVYKVGILSTGKRPTLTELARWVRSA